MAATVRLLGVTLASASQTDSGRRGREDGTMSVQSGSQQGGARPGTVTASAPGLWGRPCRGRWPRVSCPPHTAPVGRAGPSRRELTPCRPAWPSARVSPVRVRCEYFCLSGAPWGRRGDPREALAMAAAD